MEIEKTKTIKDNHPLIISSLYHNAGIINEDKAASYILNKQKIIREEEYYSKISPIYIEKTRINFVIMTNLYGVERLTCSLEEVLNDEAMLKRIVNFDINTMCIKSRISYYYNYNNRRSNNTLYIMNYPLCAKYIDKSGKIYYVSTEFSDILISPDKLLDYDNSIDLKRDLDWLPTITEDELNHLIYERKRIYEREIDKYSREFKTKSYILEELAKLS